MYVVYLILQKQFQPVNIFDGEQTHKNNVKKQHAMRVQVVIDSKDGYFRDYVCGPAGLDNDQGFMMRSHWNTPNGLVGPNEWVLADGGYFSTQHINVARPFRTARAANDQDLMEWNVEQARDRNLIECTFGVFKQRMKIFDKPWFHEKALFPLAFRVALKLMNRFWRRSEDGPLGAMRIANGYMDGY